MNSVANREQCAAQAADTQQVAHAHLLKEFRYFKAAIVKVRKSVGRKDIDRARSRYEEAPQYDVHH